MNDTGLKLGASITGISRGKLYLDNQDRVTLMVEGAEPLYAELRLPNKHKWTLGQRMMITIVAAEPIEVSDVAA